MGRQRTVMSPTARDAVTVFGARVKMARHDHGWTQRDLAERAGVSQRTVATIELGSPATSIGNAFNIAVAAGVPLFGTDDPRVLEAMGTYERERAALMPKRVRYQEMPDVDTDF